MAKTQAEQIENAVKEFRTALIKIDNVNLNTIVSTKFEIRQQKIAVELEAFIQALYRQIIPTRKREMKILGLKTQLRKLESALAKGLPLEN